MIRWIILLVLILLVSAIVYLKMGNSRPNNVGIKEDKLLSCPSSPNCVSSQENISNKKHYIAPISYEINRPDMESLLIQYLLSSKSMTIISNESGYIYMEVKSKKIGFIDDVEFYLPKSEKIIHVRSASRVGYSDRGVNRERIEKIRSDLLNQSKLEQSS